MRLIILLNDTATTEIYTLSLHYALPIFRERARTARKLTISQVIDESINQTLSRTIMTKLVTLLVVVALLIFGGETLRGFFAALVIGIIAGTYSSIYISSALALDLGLCTDDLMERKLTKPE